MGRFLAAVVALVVLAGVLSPAVAATDRSQERVTLTVSVVDGEGQAVEDATINATWDGGSTTETTAANGKAFVDVPRGADVRLWVTHPQYTRNFPAVVRDAEPRDVEVGVARKGRLTVETVDGRDDAISARVVVSTAAGREVAAGSSGADGTFESGVVERGRYTVLVFKSGYLRNRTAVSVGADTRTTVTIEQGSVTLEVRVVDDHFSPPRPIERAVVRVEDVGATRTLGNGETTISVPVNTRLTVTATKEGYNNTTRTVTVFESPENVTFATQRVPSLSVEPANRRVVVGETLRVTVTDEYGAAVEGATVTLDGDPVGTTGADGVASFPVDSAGNHTLRATRGSVASSGVTVEGVRAGGDDTATPTATPTFSPTPTDTPPTTTGVTLPGFTPATAVLAVAVAAALVAARRRRQ